MMNGMRGSSLALLAASLIWWLSGCSGKTDTIPSSKANTHKEGDHKESGDKEGGHKEGGHDEKPLTEEDVKMPASFQTGVTRLEELHKKIGEEIDEGQLKHVHRLAEEMKLVASKMKALAQKDLSADKRVEAGRLCNEVAGTYPPIDEAADAGKKAETVALHKKMGEAVAKLKGLAPQ